MFIEKNPHYSWHIKFPLKVRFWQTVFYCIGGQKFPILTNCLPLYWRFKNFRFWVDVVYGRAPAHSLSLVNRRIVSSLMRTATDACIHFPSVRIITQHIIGKKSLHFAPNAEKTRIWLTEGIFSLSFYVIFYWLLITGRGSWSYKACFFVFQKRFCYSEKSERKFEISWVSKKKTAKLALGWSRQLIFSASQTEIIFGFRSEIHIFFIFQRFS